MKRCLTVLFFLIPPLLFCGPPGKSPNLVENGDFELGKNRPTGWDIPDRLTVFWEKPPPSPNRPPGKGLRIDTDVYMKEWEKRKKEIEKNPEAPPWKKKQTSGKKYNTIAGNNGVSFYSDPIPVKKDTEYNIALDIRSNRPNAEPKIFVKGYTLHKKRMRVIYKTYLNCRLEGTGWQHFHQSFHPTKNTPKVTEMRVMIFCYWPPGEYFVDNVSITENPATPTPTPTPEPTGTQKRSP